MRRLLATATLFTAAFILGHQAAAATDAGQAASPAAAPGAASAASAGARPASTPPSAQGDTARAAGEAPAAKPRVLIKTSAGDITVELDPDKAPGTVKNFLAYVDEGHYAGTQFHRVIKGFMIQGGGYTADFTEKPTRPPISNEAENGLKNERGTLAMARSGYPHSATAQFFINLADNAFLNHQGKSPKRWGYAVFGHVVSGMDVVDKIATVPTGPNGKGFADVPTTPVMIESISRIGTQPPAN